MSKIEYGNPYTHEEHSRESFNNQDQTKECSWCGNPKKILYKYDNRKGLFCNKGCFKAYHNE